MCFVRWLWRKQQLVNNHCPDVSLWEELGWWWKETETISLQPRVMVILPWAGVILLWRGLSLLWGREGALCRCVVPSLSLHFCKVPVDWLCCSSLVGFGFGGGDVDVSSKELKPLPPRWWPGVSAPGVSRHLSNLSENLRKWRPCPGKSGKAFPQFPAAAVEEELWCLWHGWEQADRSAWPRSPIPSGNTRECCSTTERCWPAATSPLPAQGHVLSARQFVLMRCGIKFNFP